MIVAFFLSKMVPGDAAESLMHLHGVQAESNNAKIEYERNYTLLGLDKPIFYFTILPNFYPDNINSIISATDRELIDGLLKQKLPYHAIHEYMDAKTQSIKIIQAWNQNGSFSSQEEVKKMISDVAFASEANQIKHIWTKIKKVIPDSVITKCNAFQSAEILAKSKINWYYPTLRWHGIDNQFHQWASGLLRGDLGISIKDGGKVSKKILSALQWTFLLSVINLILSSLIAIPSGMIAGFNVGSWYDKISGFIWLLLYSIPVFWLASLLIVYCTSGKYGTWLNIFPVPGLWYIPEGQNIWTTISQYSHQLVLPIICLVANDIAQLSRIVRNNVIEQKSKMYVLMAKAKGVGDFGLLTQHIFPNILIPLITVLGGKLPSGLAGALIIEVIFNIPGMGRLMYNSIFSADWNVVFGILIMVSIITMLAMLITDLLYAYVNPKIKSGLS
jgi:peptide/nickel transport system permease protein